MSMKAAHARLPTDTAPGRQAGQLIGVLPAAGSHPISPSWPAGATTTSPHSSAAMLAHPLLALGWKLGLVSGTASVTGTVSLATRQDPGHGRDVSMPTPSAAWLSASSPPATPSSPSPPAPDEHPPTTRTGLHRRRHRPGHTSRPARLVPHDRPLLPRAGTRSITVSRLAVKASSRPDGKSPNSAAANSWTSRRSR